MNTNEIQTYLTAEANRLAKLTCQALVSGETNDALEFARKAIRATSLAEDITEFNGVFATSPSKNGAATQPAKRIGRPVGSKNKPKADVVNSKRPPAVVIATRRGTSTLTPASATQTETLRKILDKTIKGMKAGQTVSGIVSGATSIMGRGISTKERNTLVGLIGQLVKTGQLVPDAARTTSTVKVWKFNRQ
jgi:hypothetical protein